MAQGHWVGPLGSTRYVPHVMSSSDLLLALQVLKDEAVGPDERHIRARGLVGLGKLYMDSADSDGGKEGRLARFKKAMESMADGGMPFAEDPDDIPAWDPNHFDGEDGVEFEPMPESTPGGLSRGDMVRASCCGCAAPRVSLAPPPSADGARASAHSAGPGRCVLTGWSRPRSSTARSGSSSASMSRRAGAFLLIASIPKITPHEWAGQSVVNACISSPPGIG